MAIFSDAFQTQILFSFYSILALLSSLMYEKGLRARAPCFIVCCEGVWCNAHGTFCKLLSTTNTFCYLSFQISPISNPPLQCVLWCLLIDPSALSTCVVPEKCIQVIWRDLYLASVQWLSHFSCFCQPLYSLKVGVSWCIDGRPKISASYNTESAAMWTKINHIPHRVQTLWRNLRWFLKGCFGGIKLELAKKKKVLSRCPARKAPGASESADELSRLRRCKIHVSAHHPVVAKLVAMPSFRCGRAWADSGRNTASHWVTSLSWSFGGLCLGNLPRIPGPDLQLSLMWQSRWFSGGDGGRWREEEDISYFSNGSVNAGRFWRISNSADWPDNKHKYEGDLLKAFHLSSHLIPLIR